MKVVVLADTHIPKKAKDLSKAAYDIFDGADAIVHAGDVIAQSFLDRLDEIAPVYAVLGNNDVGLALPECLELSWEGVNLGVIHDSGDRKGRGKRLRRRFPNSDIVIFGHSHIPMNENENGLLLFNPGSPTDKRRQAFPTIGLLQLKCGKIDAEIIQL